LKDAQQEPATRVALRKIKDFAKPIDVKIGQSQELFWKFFLVNNEEVKTIIKEHFLKKPETPRRVDVEKAEPAKVEEKAKSSETQKKQETEKRIEKKEEEKQEKTKAATEKQPEQKPKKVVKKELKQQDSGGSFAEKVQKYFSKKDIEIIEKKVIRKTEIDYIVKVPSSIGTMEYYCRAKDKKKSNDGDLASAFIQGQNKKLPVLFLTTGDITKKAKDMLHKEFKGLTVSQI